MKTLLITLTNLVLTLSAHAQGTVEFANDASTAVSNIVTGAPVPAGSTFLVQLYYSYDGSSDWNSFISLTNRPATFASRGQFQAGSRSTFLPGGTTAFFQARAWESALGSTWEIAFPNWQSGSPGTLLGISQVFQVVLADPFASPPQTPTSLVGSGFKGFYVLPTPEPSSLVLGALGVAVLLWRRRK